jgi:hypothetical protein
MTYDMLGTFTFNEIDADFFRISFKIPNNCNYTITESSGDYTIAIQLNAGQTNPSTTFMNCDEDVEILNKTFVTTFEQHDKSGIIITKPKVTIGF